MQAAAVKLIVASATGRSDFGEKCFIVGSLHCPLNRTRFVSSVRKTRFISAWRWAMMRRSGFEGRPAAVLLKASRTFLAPIVEQLHADIFPDRVGAVHAHCIHGLDLYDAVTATTGDAQDVSGNFG
jgi:hypothetical protein